MLLSIIRNNCRKLFLNGYKSINRGIKNTAMENLSNTEPVDDTVDENAEIDTLTFVLDKTKNEAEKKVIELVKVMKELNIHKNAAFQATGMIYKPAHIVRYHAITLRECGFTDITAEDLVSYRSYLQKKHISELKWMKKLPKDLDVRSKLCKCIMQWPEHLHPQRVHSDDLKTLGDLRFEVMQKFLEWRIQMTMEEFMKATLNYNFFKHRPLTHIDENTTLALEKIHMPVERIKRYPFVLAVDPQNTRNILSKIKTLGGMETVKVLKFYPTVMRANCESIIKNLAILKANNITPLMQSKAVHIYTLKPETLLKRFTKLNNFPEYLAQSSNKRSLQMVLYQKKVVQRLNHLQIVNKQCTVLHKLLEPDDNNFYSYAQNFGDRSSTSDLAFAISGRLTDTDTESTREESLKKYRLVRDQIDRHENNKCVPIVTVYNTITALLEEFSKDELKANCQILLYPLENIRKTLEILSEKKRLHSSAADPSRHSDSSDSDDTLPFSSRECDSNYHADAECEETNQTNATDPFADLKYESIDNKQKLSLVLYLMEKDHSFTGGGIWDGYKGVWEPS